MNPLRNKQRRIAEIKRNRMMNQLKGLETKRLEESKPTKNEDSLDIFEKKIKPNKNNKENSLDSIENDTEKIEKIKERYQELIKEFWINGRDLDKKRIDSELKELLITRAILYIEYFLITSTFGNKSQDLLEYLKKFKEISNFL